MVRVMPMERSCGCGEKSECHLDRLGLHNDSPKTQPREYEHIVGLPRGDLLAINLYCIEGRTCTLRAHVKQ